MKKSLKFIGIILTITFIFGLGVFLCYGNVLVNNIKNKAPYPFHNGNDHLIAHAGGAIDGNVYTDSREAVENAIKYGYKFIEIDFINEYAFTKFGEVLLDYCQEMYIGLREDVDFVLEALGVEYVDSDDYVECEMVGIEPWLNYGDDEDEDEEGCIAF